MGWNSWNKFHRNVDDKAVKITRNGRCDGVERHERRRVRVYVNIDADTWEGTRDASGVLQSNEKVSST